MVQREDMTVCNAVIFRSESDVGSQAELDSAQSSTCLINESLNSARCSSRLFSR